MSSAAGPGDALTASVVICVYTEDRWADIVRAVRSVESQTTAPLETILAVDPNPPLRARAAGALPGGDGTENIEARGLAGARNWVFGIARGDIVAFLDDDAWAEPDWLGTL